MKRFFYLTAVAIGLAVAFTSCKKDNDTVSTLYQMTMTTEKENVELYSVGDGKAVVDWGDGQMDTYTLSENIFPVYTHSYSGTTPHTIKVNGDHITKLYCYDNLLTSLNVSSNAALQYLHCHNNQLTGIDVSSNTALTSLMCGKNQLTSLDVSNNIALEQLYCYHNQLTGLDVSSNTALYILWCDGNQLTSLNLSNNAVLLTELYCNDNHMTGEALDTLFGTLPDRSSLAPNGTI